MEIITKSEQETKEVAQVLGKEALTIKQDKALVFVLQGDLGSGKTTFVQGFAKGLGVKERILSPTFVLMKRFKANSRELYHFDCYRIKNEKEILNLDFKEILDNPNNIIVLEWGDKIKKILPKKSFLLKFACLNREERKIKIQEL